MTVRDPGLGRVVTVWTECAAGGGVWEGGHSEAIHGVRCSKCVCVCVTSWVRLCVCHFVGASVCLSVTFFLKIF